MKRLCSDEALALQAQHGDHAAERELVNRHARTAEFISSRYGIRGADAEDVEQEALFALVLAIRGYRADRNATFRTFAEHVIRRRLFTAVKVGARTKHDLLTRAIRVGRDEYGDEKDILELLPDTRDLEAADEACETLAQVVARWSTLSPIERHALLMVINREPYRGDKMIDNAAQRAKRKLRAAA